MSKPILEIVIELRKFVNTWGDYTPLETDPSKVKVDECILMLEDAMDIFGLEFHLVDIDNDKNP